MKDYDMETIGIALRLIEEKIPTLRDCLAGEALNGMLAHARHGHGYRPRPEDAHLGWHGAISKEAYEIADAMLKAREVE
jgi:hypothetical protein